MTTTGPFNTPFTFTPIYKEKLWGGQSLSTALSKDIPENRCIGESWELSGYGSDISQAVLPEGTTISIQDLLENNARELLGVRLPSPLFPLLFKFIDANDNLSVQVHPSDVQAKKQGWGKCGKTECWYIVDAKPAGEIIVGFKKDITREAVKAAIQNNTLDTLLNRIPIAAGDVLFIPAGTVHAILDGTLLYEVQQTSDTTFRFHDWGRVDNNGNPRQLHIAESLDVCDTAYHEQHKIPAVTVQNQDGIMHSFRAACRYFALEEYVLSSGADFFLPSKQSFSVISILEGSLSFTAKQRTFSKGQTVFIPANICHQPIHIQAHSETRFLLSSIPGLATEVVEYLRNAGIPDETILLLGGHGEHNDLTPLLQTLTM